MIDNNTFKDKYYSDNWQKYEVESNLLETKTEKIIYWKNKLIEYKTDKITLDYLGTLLLTLDIKLKNPKHLNGHAFDTFCQHKIDLLHLEKIKKNKKEWNLEDNYNHYLETKRFGFIFIKNYKKNEYDDIKKELSSFKELYFFIYNKLPKDGKNEFKFDFLDNLKATKEKQTLTKFKEIISNLITEIDKQPQQKETNKPKENEDIHPKFKPNLWSLDCYKLFKYLFDNYYKDSRKPTKRQLTNIWFYLNEYDKIKYNLKATKDSYKLFIKKYYGIEIKNFDKAEQKYNTEYGTMNDHRINFEDSF